MNVLVVGLGEVGQPLYELINGVHRAYDIDIKNREYEAIAPKTVKFDIMHICVPYSKVFVQTVKNYQTVYKPKLTIIESTVPVGTTRKIGGDTVHSPVLGMAPHMKRDLLRFRKLIGTLDKDHLEPIYHYYQSLGIDASALVLSAEDTEFLKLYNLATYGTYIAWEQEAQRMAKHFDVPYSHCKVIKRITQDGGVPRPMYYPGVIEGECVMSAIEKLLQDYPSSFLSNIIASNSKRRFEVAKDQ